MATSLSDFVAADAGRDGPPEAHSDAGSVTGQSVASGTTALTAVSWSTHRSQASTVQAGPVIEAEPKHKIVKASRPSDSSSNFAKPVAISDKRVSCQTFYFATRCNAVVHVDFYSSECCDGAKVRVKEVHDAEILSEAEDFADFITPVFHVTLNCGPRDSMPDGQSVDLIVEVDVEGGVNTNALAFVKRSSASADDVWGGVIGGEFETLPSPTGLRMRGRITTSSFSFWGVACCHAKVAMHHIHDGRARKLNLIVYSGAPEGSYPIPRDWNHVQNNVHTPMLKGFCMLQNSEGQPILMKHGKEFEVRLECDGVTKSQKAEWKHSSSYVACEQLEFDVQDIPSESWLKVRICRESTALVHRPRNGIREYAMRQENLLPHDCEKVDKGRRLRYWPEDVQACSPGPGKITCGYCFKAASEEEYLAIKGGGSLKVGPCCKGIKSLLLSGPGLIRPASEPAASPSADTAAVMQLVPGQGARRGQEAPTSSGKRPQGGLPVIEGFFCKKVPDKKQLLRDMEAVKRADAADKDERLMQLESQLMALETIDVHNEAQALTSKLSGGRRVFEILVHSQPSFDTFKRSMRSAKERTVRVLHLSGHGEFQCGFFWLKNQVVSTEYEQVSLDTFIRILQTEMDGASGGTIECVVLNACETEEMGKKLRGAGVSYVVCWQSEVQDNTAREFALQFYASLNEQDPTRARDYRRAFKHAASRISSGGGAQRAPAKHLAVGAVDFVCLLSESGNEFPDTGHIRQESDEDDLGSCAHTGQVFFIQEGNMEQDRLGCRKGALCQRTSLSSSYSTDAQDRKFAANGYAGVYRQRICALPRPPGSTHVDPRGPERD